MVANCDCESTEQPNENDMPRFVVNGSKNVFFCTQQEGNLDEIFDNQKSKKYGFWSILWSQSKSSILNGNFLPARKRAVLNPAPAPRGTTGAAKPSGFGGRNIKWVDCPREGVIAVLVGRFSTFLTP